jgi:hypothetical protein
MPTTTDEVFIFNLCEKELNAALNSGTKTLQALNSILHVLAKKYPAQESFLKTLAGLAHKNIEGGFLPNAAEQSVLNQLKQPMLGGGEITANYLFNTIKSINPDISREAVTEFKVRLEKIGVRSIFENIKTLKSQLVSDSTTAQDFRALLMLKMIKLIVFDINANLPRPRLSPNTKGVGNDAKMLEEMIWNLMVKPNVVHFKKIEAFKKTQNAIITRLQLANVLNNDMAKMFKNAGEVQ